MTTATNAPATEELPQKILDESNGLWYTLRGDCYLPSLIAPSGNRSGIGMWGRRRRDYLKNHRPAVYAVMKAEDILREHLYEVNASAEQMLTDMVHRMAKAQSITEAMKRTDQMGWVGAMNNIRAQAAEIINSEIIYV